MPDPPRQTPDPPSGKRDHLRVRDARQYTVLVAPDGASYAYGYSRGMGDLYLVSGLR